MFKINDSIDKKVMFPGGKANGREKPANQKELSRLKGKRLHCPKCNRYQVAKKSVFGSELCGNCGEKLVGAEGPGDYKTTG